MKKKFRERGQISMGATELNVIIPTPTSSSGETGQTKQLRVGQYLVNLREEKQISLKQIAKDTKVNIKILTSLENGDFTSLPSRPYVRGFVVSYCRCLGISSDEAVKLLENEYNPVASGSAPSAAPSVVVEPQNTGTAPLTLVSSSGAGEAEKAFTPSPVEAPKKPLKLNSRKDFLEEEHTPEEKVNGFFLGTIDAVVKWRIPIAAATGLIVFTVLVVKGLSSLSNEMKQAKKATSVTSVAPTDIKPVEANLLVTDKLVQLREEAQKPVATTAPAPVAEVKPVEPPVVEVERVYPEKEFHKVYSPQYQLDEGAPEIKDSALYPESVREAAGVNFRADLYVVAVDGNLWAHFKVDEKKLGRRSIKQGTALHLQGETIRITSGDLRKGKVFYNGSLVQVQSTSGIKSMVFPESEQTKFEIPLFVQNKKGELLEGEEYKKRMLEEKAKTTTSP